MTTQHTPGPWMVHPYAVRTGEYNSGRDVGTSSEAVCMVIGEFETGQMGAKAIANARLIAAAPELLAALRIMVNAVNVKELDPLIVFASIERARAALAKATE